MVSPTDGVMFKRGTCQIRERFVQSVRGHYLDKLTGLIATFARPGGNVTGLAAASFTAGFAKRLELLKAIAPMAKRVAILQSDLHGLDAAQQAARRLEAVFANGGSLMTPHVIDRVLAADGSVLEETDAPSACPLCPMESPTLAGDPPVIVPGNDGGAVNAADVGGSLPAPGPEQTAPRVISEANAWIITDMLHDVITRGTGQRARALGRGDIAGKTGTTNEGRDAWFSGFNPDLVATAWVGFDQERSLGRDEEGARTALPMWIYFMREALAGVPQHRLPMPAGVVTARVAPDASVFDGDAPPEFEYFLADHLP